MIDKNKRSLRVNSKNTTKIDSPSNQDNLFFMSNGIRKRKIFYNVIYSQQEEQWIRNVRKILYKEKRITIDQDQTVLRFYYSANFDMEICINHLAKYDQWFSSNEIQTVSKQAREILCQGFIYSYNKTKQGNPLIIMNLSKIDLKRYKVVNYYQALNYVNNKAINQQCIPGEIETYTYMLDLNQELLSLPLTSLGEIITTISDSYSMKMEFMKIVNCNYPTKIIYSGVCRFISEQTQRKINLYTRSELEEGCLHDFVDKNDLEMKYGGFRRNIDYTLLFQQEQKLQQCSLQQTLYLSMISNEEFFNNNNETCCGHTECNLY